MNLKTPFKLR